MDNVKKKLFIISSKDLYWFISDNLDNIIDLNEISPIYPYDFDHRNYIDDIILNNSKNHIIKSHDYVMSLAEVDSLDSYQVESLRKKEAIKHSYNEWLSDKFNYSKKMISESDLCLVLDSDMQDEVTKKEITKEIKFATNKNKPILTINIDKIYIKNKQYSLHNDKKAA